MKMASAFQDSSASAVHIINLSVNAIEDKGTDADILSGLRSSLHLLIVFLLCTHADIVISLLS